MKKQVVLICTVFLMLSVAIIGTSVATYPKQAEAYISSTYNYTFNNIVYLPNGYRVGIVGVGYEKHQALNLFTSAHVGVQVLEVKPTRSQLRSVKLIHQTSGYKVDSLNIFNAVKYTTQNLTATCDRSGSADCTLHNGATISGMVFSPSVSVRAEITFNDGVYTVYANQRKTAQ